MAQNPKPSPVAVGKDGFLYADGIKLGRFIPESKSIQFFDRDRRRCAEKGREAVEIKISDLANLSDKK
jgi:hypothetical protein